MLYALFYWSYMSFFPFQTLYLTSHGCSEEIIGILSIFTALCNFLIQFPVGALSGRYVTPLKLLQVFFLASIPAAFLFLLPQMHLFTVLLAVIPVTMLDFSAIGQMDSLSVQLEQREPSIKYSRLRAVGSLTGALASAVMGQLYVYIGIDKMFAVHTVFLLMAFACSILLQKCIPVSLLQPASKEAPAKASLRKPASAKYGSLFVGAGLLFLGWRANLIYLPVRLVDCGGNSSHQGLCMALMSLSAMAAMLLFPILEKRFSLRAMLIFGGLCMVLRMLLTGWAHTALQLILLQLLEAPSYGLLQPSIMKLIERAAPETEWGFVISLWLGVQMALCTVVANLLVLVLLQVTSLNVAFVILAPFTAAGLPILLHILKQRQKEVNL